MDDERTKRLIRTHESLRLKVYRDSLGIATIGWGRNLEDVGISAAEANELFENDYASAVFDAGRLVGAGWHSLGAVRQAVLADMAFNLGRPRLRGFRRMLAAVRASDWDKAAEEMLDSRWAEQVGNRATKLAGMMRSGLWP